VYELVCKNGEHRWAEIRTRPLKEGDIITGIHGIGRDITEKIKTEQKLLESEIKYRELFENATMVYILMISMAFFSQLMMQGARYLNVHKG